MSEYAIQLRGVSRQYPHFQLQDINLALPTGGIMGLIGPNGAGKSTLIRIMMGLVGADAGDVLVLGHRIPNAQVLAKNDIGFASEDMRLYKNATLQWHMHWVAKVFPEQWDGAYAQQLLQSFDLIAAQKIKGMSHGQRVKSGLLLMLARHPRLLILDEPTTGLDPVARKEVLNEMMQVLADESRSVLFSSHNTQDVEHLSDQITFIDRGQLVSSKDKESYLESWRRVQVKLPSKEALAPHPQITEVIQHGHSANLVIKDYAPDMLDHLTAQGATIGTVSRMTLEEIFVAEVEYKRNQTAAGVNP
ncbi:ABC transporter ATP-binding protein [Marinicella meishanensis]|uniref:ABC transporter ATP-binding protein n=1 Tax=Marinicella meishanensis TaxID=2873263 RepID=UPI001CBB2F3B|nr:ABC transporter ATP-binding protein [Marinicella sp. NBU2979]